MNNKMNMKTIAELAGVSVSTVSRVINQNGRFSAETEENVRRVMRELNFYPNVVAKNLRENRSNVIGVIVPDITNPHFAKLVLEIEKKLFEHAYSTVICNTNESAELERRHIDTLISQRVSGILVISGRSVYDLNGIPVIYVDRRPRGYEEDRHCIVESDNQNGGYLAARKLIECGCSRIGILYSFRMDHNQKMRYQGYKKAMEEAKLEEHFINVNQVSFPVATDAVREYIERGNMLDGLVCTTDVLAIGAIIGLQEKNITVPGQVRLTGFDDTELARIYHPTISSIHQFVNQMADRAIELLFSMMKEEKLSSLHHTIPVRLVERESTKVLN